MKITNKIPQAKDYISLRIRSGMGEKDLQKSEIALQNSLFTVSIYQDEILIGFGRIVGDGGITYIVSDIMVDKNYQRQGLGQKIMQEIDEYFEKNTDDNSFICLIANIPADKLYKKYKFNYLPNNRCAMMRNI